MKNFIKKILNKKIILLGLILLTFYYCAKNKKTQLELYSNAPDKTSITLSFNVPMDITDPSDLAEAANFAWNEFIALTWPAQAQGPIDYPRGKAYTIGKYGDKGPTGQVVWETYRHRVEAFPGKGDPNGYNASLPDYGFSSKPEYIYENPIPPLNPAIPEKIPPFINLDEVTQIGLNQMYAGAYGNHTGDENSVVENQQILFLAKVNESYYKYIAENKFFDSGDSIVQEIKKNSANYAITGDGVAYPPPYTNLPSSNVQANTEGAIEIKAGWRRLNPQIEDISTFYTSPVRYYEGDDATMAINGYVDSDDPGVNEIWGLVALHIIHKTPNAPAFVYATFSHYNNILDADGNSVEDKDGTTYPQYLAQEPFSPVLGIINAPVDTLGYQNVYTVSGKVNTNSPQLYFQNSKNKEAINVGSITGPLYKDPVVVNRRLYPIPPTIVNANKTAHALIKAANTDAVWLNYKMVNVQAEPLDYIKDSLRIKNGLAPTYFMANEVVETNPSLQNFSGGLLDVSNTVNPDGGSIFNYGYNPITFAKEYDNNVFIRSVNPPKIVNMGGCMGCHGSQGQKMGGDFSVLLANGRILEPDVVQLDVKNAAHVQYLTDKYKLNKTN